MKDKDDRVGLRVVGREMKRIKCWRILFCGALVSLMLCNICLTIQKTCLIKYNSPEVRSLSQQQADSKW